MIAQFRTTLAQSHPAPLEVLTVTLDPRASTQPTIHYIRATFADRPPDLVVPFGRPAVTFALGQRGELFTGTPILLGGVASFSLKGLTLSPGVGAVSMDSDVGPSLARGVGYRPREVISVLGSSVYESAWREEVQRILSKAFDAPVSDTFGMSMEQIRERVAKLDPESLVVMTVFAVDGSGVPWEFDSAVRQVLAVSRAPVISTVETEFGSGVLGVAALQVVEAGRQTGLEAARILEGGAPRVLPTIPVAPLRIDDRVVQRLKFAAWTLPEGAELHFHEPSTWERLRPYAFGTLLVVLVEASLILLLLVNRRERLRAEAEARLLARNVVKAQEEERARIARELHDDISQRVAWLSILAAREDPSRDQCAELSAALSTLGRDLNRVAYSLHPDALESVGLAAAVDELAERFGGASGIDIVVERGELPGDLELPQAVSLCAFRVVQEALRNAWRHGEAKHVRVLLAVRDGGLQLAVDDDGKGFDPRNVQRRGLGLLSMRERVRELGGSFDVESRPGEGAEMVVWLPLEPGQDKEGVA
jgi:signal transduction histidine kinase